MTVTDTDRIVLQTTDNEMTRFLDGIPKRPENVPESVVKAVEVFARAMIDKEFWHGWFGDQSKPFFDDCVNSYLQMPNWSNKERAHATLHCDLGNAVQYTKVPKETLEEIATYCGYSVEWSDSWVTPIKELISIKKPLQAMVQATQKCLAKMEALLTSTEPYTANDVSQIVNELNAIYAANLPKPEQLLPEPSLDPLTNNTVSMMREFFQIP